MGDEEPTNFLESHQIYRQLPLSGRKFYVPFCRVDEAIASTVGYDHIVNIGREVLRDRGIFGWNPLGMTRFTGGIAVGLRHVQEKQLFFGGPSRVADIFDQILQAADTVQAGPDRGGEVADLFASGLELTGLSPLHLRPSSPLGKRSPQVLGYGAVMLGTNAVLRQDHERQLADGEQFIVSAFEEILSSHERDEALLGQALTDDARRILDMFPEPE